MNDELVVGSLAYRKNEAAILRGDVPEKYTRLLPYIPGKRILEIGSAEGVLALTLARAGKTVTALERRTDRHDAALRLRDIWGGASPVFINAAVGDSLDLLEGKDTLVAVRVIYYLGADLDRLFAAAAEKVPNVVLCGNKGRAMWWREGLPNKHDRADNYYASANGMCDVLERHGYEITDLVMDGDPIVVGRR